MLQNLNKHTTKKNRRIGRGYGSAKGGHTSTRGQKGQKSRSGYKPARRGFEGGSMPLSRRLPKLKGFKRGYFKSRNTIVEISLTELEVFAAGETVSPESLREKNLITTRKQNITVKILGNGDITKKLNIENIAVSAPAKAKIEAKGGTVA